MFLVFSVSIVGFEKVKSWQGSNIQLSKSPWYTPFVLCNKRLIYSCQGRIRTCGTSKMELFARIVYTWKSVTILTRNSHSHIKTFYCVLNLSRVFFQICISPVIICISLECNPLSVQFFLCIHVEEGLLPPLYYLKFHWWYKVEICSSDDLYEVMIIDNSKIKIYLILKIVFSSCVFSVKS